MTSALKRSIDRAASSLTPDEDKRLIAMCGGVSKEPRKMYDAVTRMLSELSRDDREYLKLRLRLTTGEVTT